jgi:hypothetical protein
MTPLCIHGFRSEHCASCRTCPHGLVTAGCGRCLAASTSAARRRPAVTLETPPSEEHAGFEIFYVPAVTGWQFRRPEAASSELSYRSVFLARKAIDALVAGTKAGRASKQRA